MGQNTSRLGLYLPGGGSTGLITPDEPADIDKINDNMTKLDADAGAYVCTSSTRPATPYNGKIIFETDTRKTMVYKSATTSWEPVDSQGKIVANAAARDALFASPTQGTMVFRNDLGYSETYFAAYNASTNPGGRTPAGWYTAPRNVGLVPIVPPTVAVSGGSATANTLGVVTFTGVTSISLNDIFSSTYSSYRVLISKLICNTASTPVKIRLRAGGSDYTGNQHYLQGMSLLGNATSPGAYAAVNSSYIEIGHPPTTASYFSASFDIHNPTGTIPVSLSGQSYGYSTSVIGYSYGCLVDAGTSRTGFTIFTNSSATYTGQVQVFGYNS